MSVFISSFLLRPRKGEENRCFESEWGRFGEMPRLRHKLALLDARSLGTKPGVAGDKKTEEDAIGGNLSHASDIALWRK